MASCLDLRGKKKKYIYIYILDRLSRIFRNLFGDLHRDKKIVTNFILRSSFTSFTIILRIYSLRI